MDKDAKRCMLFRQPLPDALPTAELNEALARCFHAEMERFARYRCSDRALAEDVAQEALLLAMEALGSFRGEAPIEVWLKRVVRTACHRFTRGMKNDSAAHSPLDAIPEGQLVAPQSEVAELSLLLAERVARLREVLVAVEEPNRSLLLLHEGEGVSIEVLGQRFGLSAEAVKSRLKRTRAALRRRLEAAGMEASTGEP